MRAQLWKPFAFALALVAAPVAASPTTILVDFDAVPVFDEVDGFYAGGTSGSGATGPDLGVGFTHFFILPGGTSLPNFAIVNAETDVINTAFAFNSFAFTAGFAEIGTVELWSGADGTGFLLGSLSGQLGTPLAFQSFSIPFSGDARSVVIIGPSGGSAVLAFDDLQFGIDPGVIPEPAGWALMITGFGLAGAALRRQRPATA
jgi:hypothetical protein